MPPEPCEECGVLDALDRHDPTCPRAIQLGLSRLAEGEEPIDPREMEDPNEESGYDGPVAEEDEVSPNHPAHPQWHEQPQRMIRAQAMASAIEPPKLYAGLWFAYPPNDGVKDFDAVIFDSELDALRYAVEHSWKVRQLDMGESIREQVQGA